MTLKGVLRFEQSFCLRKVLRQTRCPAAKTPISPLKSMGELVSKCSTYLQYHSRENGALYSSHWNQWAVDYRPARVSREECCL